ncbi:MAG: hypothetical protein U0176_04940 [Bacteroidia bacterium]
MAITTTLSTIAVAAAGSDNLIIDLHPNPADDAFSFTTRRRSAQASAPRRDRAIEPCRLSAMGRSGRAELDGPIAVADGRWISALASGQR